jgi:hypothetical protein
MMQGPAMLRWFVCLAVLTSLLAFQESFGDQGRLSVEANVGVGRVSLSDIIYVRWDVNPASLNSDRLGGFLSLAVAYSLADRHSVTFGVESIESSALLSSPIIYTDEWGDTTGIGELTVHYDVHGLPLNLSYEYRPALSVGRSRAFLGIGLSYFITDVNAEVTVDEPSEFPVTYKHRRDGRGYGINAFAGLRSWITPSLYMAPRIRARYADGMAFARSDEDVEVKFTGIDIAFSVGYTF